MKKGKQYNDKRKQSRTGANINTQKTEVHLKIVKKAYPNIRSIHSCK